jgi:hypothetical protein
MARRLRRLTQTGKRKSLRADRLRKAKPPRRFTVKSGKNRGKVLVERRRNRTDTRGSRT